MTQPNSSRDRYYAQAQSWSEDVIGALRRSRARAYWVAGVASFVAALLAIALIFLMPLKTVVPYTITVDRQTGYAQLQRGVQLGPLSERESLIQASLAQYVLARETLDASDLAENYRKVGLWSTGTALSDYLALMDRNNPQSILQGATQDTQIRTTIKSIALLGADKNGNSALVRFYTDRRDGAGPVTRTDWAAVIQFSQSGKPLSLEDRLINPLGFQVSRYRRDQEAVTQLPAFAPTTPTVNPAAPGSGPGSAPGSAFGGAANSTSIDQLTNQLSNRLGAAAGQLDSALPNTNNVQSAPANPVPAAPAPVQPFAQQQGFSTAPNALPGSVPPAATPSVRPEPKQ
jgi:type IV secretion system protein VirB8